MNFHYLFAILAFVLGFLSPMETIEAEMGKREAVPDAYVRMPKLMIPIIQNRELKEFCSFAIVIMAEDEKAAERIRAVLPRMTDIAFVDSFALLGVVWSDDTHLHLPELKKRLKERYNNYFKKPLVKDVLIQYFSDKG